MKKTTIAIMYDFDKTLCTKDMQEYSFIPSVNMTSEEFWSEVNDFSKENNMDSILAYMYFMLKKAKENNLPITRDVFINAGKNIELYPGVETWFKRINEYAKTLNVEVEHYIISSGMKEIIEGSTIKDEFKKIYACEYYYNDNKFAEWPSLVVNYTNKTQYLFRINKGVLDISDDKSLNSYVPEDNRSIPFRNMIYIGDGLTDVPCMKLVKSNGGQSIAVYKNNNTEMADKLLKEQRVDFITPANYEANSMLENIVFSIIEKMKKVDDLANLHHKQLGEID